MVLHRQLAICSLDRAVIGVARNLQKFVIVGFGRHQSALSPASPPSGGEGGVLPSALVVFVDFGKFGIDDLFLAGGRCITAVRSRGGRSSLLLARKSVV